ncbi:MAG: DHHA1 domain-containing protein [Coriobacteriia bacterium]|nr:DHHA1 domain-containing protein [Coriobacteriia bacterium]
MVPADTLQAAAAILRDAPHVVIGSHVDPDGDAIGSSLGLAFALDQLGVPVTLVLGSGSRCPATYAFLPGSERLGAPPAEVDGPYVFAALDSPDVSRLGAGTDLAKRADSLLLIDHHPDATRLQPADVLDSSAAATGMLVWQLLSHLGATPDERIATCLYTATLTDTGRFSYSNTTPDTLRAAADMADAGAHPNDIYSAVYENRSAGAQMLVGRTLARVTIANGGHVAYSWITEDDFADTGALPEESENLIDFVRALGGVDVVFLAKVNGTTVRGNLRSKSDTDVSAVARMLGGGGHRAAAGFTLEGDLDTLLARLLPLLPGGQK